MSANNSYNLTAGAPQSQSAFDQTMSYLDQAGSFIFDNLMSGNIGTAMNPFAVVDHVLPNSSANSNTAEAISSHLDNFVNTMLTHEVAWGQQNREYNAKEAQKLRDWQEYMSNTAYQRAMLDMKAAGLNPILAYQQGGASTPGGSAASYSTSAGFSTKDITDSIGAVLKYIINKLVPDANAVVGALGSILG